jgi:uncharacterized membrane protein
MNCCILIAILSLIAFITALVSMNKIKNMPDTPGSSKKELQNQNMIIMLATFITLVTSLGCLAMKPKA